MQTDTCYSLEIKDIKITASCENRQGGTRQYVSAE